MPYSETVSGILGDLTFTPDNACTQDDTISVSPELQVDNYNFSYNPGNLIIEKAALTLEIGSSFISAGDAIPTNFEIVVNGLVCDDVAPNISSIVKDENGDVQTGSLDGGTYEVFADLSSYNNYTITQIPGSLFVNPVVGCNDRIKASGLCQSPATLTGNPSVISLLRFEYTNKLDVPIFIPNGPNNRLKGNAQFVGSPPELFLPGTHTFDIYTKQWEVITQGCSSASKSANGSNADPCDEATTASRNASETETSESDLVPLTTN